MIRIRPEQVEALEKSVVPDPEARLLAYVQQVFPRRCAFLGQDVIRAAIRRARERALTHDVKSDRGQRLFVSLALLLGNGFDTDPQLPWAAALLRDRSLTDETVRMDRLYERGRQYVEQVTADYQGFRGRVDSHGAIEELARLRHESPAPLSRVGVADFTRRTTERLRRTFPVRCQALGDEVVRAVIAHGIAHAGRYAVTSERGALVFVVMGFLLGSAFDTEPQLPWVAAILQDAALEPAKKVDRLYAEAVHFLKHWWSVVNPREAKK